MFGWNSKIGEVDGNVHRGKMGEMCDWWGVPVGEIEQEGSDKLLAKNISEDGF